MKNYYVISKLKIVKITKKEITCQAERLNTFLYFNNKKSFKIFTKIVTKSRYRRKLFKIRFSFDEDRKIIHFVTPYSKAQKPNSHFSSISFINHFGWSRSNDYELNRYQEAQCIPLGVDKEIEIDEIDSCFDSPNCNNIPSCLFCAEIANYPFDQSDDKFVVSEDQLKTIYQFILDSILQDTIGNQTIIKTNHSQVNVPDNLKVSYNAKDDFCDCRAIYIHFLLLKFSKQLIGKKIRTSVVLAPKPHDNLKPYTKFNSKDNWIFHIAPCLKVKKSDNTEDYFVIDPLFDLTKPRLIRDWFDALKPKEPSVRPIIIQGWVIGQQCIFENCDSNVKSPNDLQILPGLDFVYKKSHNNSLKDITTIQLI